ncbi:MAG: secretin N-terminal domain-containing protein [Alphaproteobacteria bacterium]|nr:secretin N-terminal domain-containing protein [Alphaproteobacteria bacterium]
MIDHRIDQAVQMGEDAQKPAPEKSYNPLVVSNKLWSGNKSIRLQRGIPLPSKFESARGVTLISSEPLSASEIAASVTTQTGIPVRYAAGAVNEGMGSDDGAVGSDKMPMAYEGPLSGLLDVLCGTYGLTWRYDGVSIRISKYETRVFVMEALPGTQSIKDGIKEDSGSGSSSSSSSAGAGGSYSMGSSNTLKQTSEMNIELKVWDELGQTINSILGGVGSVVMSPSSGTATVTTTPELMGVVAKYIEEENRRLSRQIAINVEIYSVALQDHDDFNVTFDTALKKLSSAFSANYSTLTGPIASSTEASAGQLSVAILNPERTGQITSLFSALSSVGDTTRVSQFPMTTLNNRSVSRRVGRDRTYVAAISNSESTTSSFSSSTVTPSTVREGFSLQLTPRVLEDGRILMQYSLNLIDVLDLVDFDTGSAGKIQLPETSNRVFVQQAMLRSGSTLIIGGYDDEQLSQSSRGVGSAYNYFLGGGSSNSKSRAMMFIAITPQILDIPTLERN